MPRWQWAASNQHFGKRFLTASIPSSGVSFGAAAGVSSAAPSSSATATVVSSAAGLGTEKHPHAAAVGSAGGRRDRLSAETSDPRFLSRNGGIAGLRLEFLKHAMKRYGRPASIVTDRLRSYRAAMSAIGNAAAQTCGRWLNNRAENSHQPFRRREGAMARFRDETDHAAGGGTNGLPGPLVLARGADAACAR